MTSPSWTNARPYRNRSPLDLRPRGQQPPWPGQVALDEAEPSPPFATFASIPDGWCAGGLWLLLACDQWKLNTPAKMISTFAPWVENNVSAYVATVCKPLNITPDTVVDPHNAVFRRAMLHAMAHVEDYQVVWSDAELDAGNMLVDARWPAFLEAYLGGQRATPRAAHPVAPPVVAASDDAATAALNDAEAVKIEQDGTT